MLTKIRPYVVKLTNYFCVKEVCSGSEDAEELNPFYAPLTCDLCHETFTTPALWVRHVERHPTSDLRSGWKKNSVSATFTRAVFTLCRNFNIYFLQIVMP